MTKISCASRKEAVIGSLGETQFVDSYADISSTFRRMFALNFVVRSR